jgi:hypothetical protein
VLADPRPGSTAGFPYGYSALGRLRSRPLRRNAGGPSPPKPPTLRYVTHCRWSPPLPAPSGPALSTRTLCPYRGPSHPLRVSNTVNPRVQRQGPACPTLETREFNARDPRVRRWRLACPTLGTREFNARDPRVRRWGLACPTLGTREFNAGDLRVQRQGPACPTLEIRVSNARDPRVQRWRLVSSTPGTCVFNAGDPRVNVRGPRVQRRRPACPTLETRVSSARDS